MNETLKTILNRRSVRSYEANQITDDELSLILEAAKYAPSAMNQQSYLFVAVQNKELMDKLIELGKDAIKATHNPFYDAPTVILVFADKKAIAPVQDASLAIENIFLSATSLNIGSCWIHCVNPIFNTDKGKELQKEMGVSDEYMIVGSCTLGYPAKEPQAAPKRKENSIIILK